MIKEILIDDIPPDHQPLIPAGTQKEKGSMQIFMKTLVNITITLDVEATPLHMMLSLRADMQIVVKTLVKFLMDIGYVEAKIQDRKGIPATRRLNIAANQFEEGRTISDFLGDHMQIFLKTLMSIAIIIDVEATPLHMMLSLRADMQIVVKTLVKFLMDIGYVEAKIQDRKDIPATRRLNIADNQFEEGRTFSDFLGDHMQIYLKTLISIAIILNVEANPIHMLPSLRVDMQIVVKTLLRILMDIGYVKAKIQDKKGIPATRRLCFAANQFEEGRTISDFLGDYMQILLKTLMTIAIIIDVESTPLHMMSCLRADMQIVVKTMLKILMDIGYVKAKIQDKKGIM